MLSRRAGICHPVTRRSVARSTRLQKSASGSEVDFEATEHGVRREPSPRGGVRRNPSAAAVELHRSDVLVEHAQPRLLVPLGSEVVQDFVVRLPSEASAPGVDCSTEVKDLVGLGSCESGEPSVPDNGEAVRAWVVDLCEPPRADGLDREWVGVLREDVAQPSDGTGTLHGHQLIEVGLSQDPERRHADTLATRVILGDLVAVPRWTIRSAGASPAELGMVVGPARNAANRTSVAVLQRGYERAGDAARGKVVTMSAGEDEQREPTLHTVRLLLRPWRVSEAVVLHELWTERDPRVPTHRQIGADGRPTVADLEESVRSNPPTTVGLLAVELVKTGEVIGYCGLVDSGRPVPGEPELAFEVLRRQWGRGYATEASLAVMDWARSSGHERLWATVWDWNTASRRVLAKLGFLETGQREPDPARGITLFTMREL